VSSLSSIHHTLLQDGCWLDGVGLGRAGLHRDEFVHLFVHECVLSDQSTPFQVVCSAACQPFVSMQLACFCCTPLLHFVIV